MASFLLQAKDAVMSKMTPDCLKASKDELKNFANEVKSKTGGGGGGETTDPDDPNNKHKITEWEAGWNITNAIQVFLELLLELLQVDILRAL